MGFASIYGMTSAFHLQAEQQLTSGWILMRAGNLGVPTTSEWLNNVLVPGCRIGIDPVSNVSFLFSIVANDVHLFFFLIALKLMTQSS